MTATRSPTGLRRRSQRVGTTVVMAAAAACILAITAEVLRDGATFALADRPLSALLELVASASIIAVGVVATARGTRGGVTASALGAAWLVREWANPAAPAAWIFTAGLLFVSAWLPLVGRVMLVHPFAGAGRRGDQLVHAFVAFAALAPAAVRTATLDPIAAGCGSCQANLFLVADIPIAASVAAFTGIILQGVACIVLLAWTARDVITASHEVRRARAPVVLAGSAMLLAAAAADAVVIVTGSNAHEAMRRVTDVQSLGLLALAIAMAVAEPIRSRLIRRRIARLVSELSSTPRPGALRDELARLTDDDTITLGYPLEDGRLVDADGRTVADARLRAGAGAGTARRSATLVQRDGRVLAVLSHRPGLLDDTTFRNTVARTSGLVIENERLRAELATQVEDLRRSRATLVTSFDEERRRLERSLHDGAQQRAVGLLLTLRLTAARRPGARIDEAISEVESALEELRDLAHGLYPASLAEEGLGSALQELAERATIPVRIVSAPSIRMAEPVETTGFAVISTTIDRPDLASAEVEAECSGGELAISVHGRLATDQVSPTAGPPDGVALDDRVGAVGGSIRTKIVDSSIDVLAVLPCVS